MNACWADQIRTTDCVLRTVLPMCLTLSICSGTETCWQPQSGEGERLGSTPGPGAADWAAAPGRNRAGTRQWPKGRVSETEPRRSHCFWTAAHWGPSATWKKCYQQDVILGPVISVGRAGHAHLDLPFVIFRSTRKKQGHVTSFQAHGLFFFHNPSRGQILQHRLWKQVFHSAALHDVLWNCTLQISA